MRCLGRLTAFGFAFIFICLLPCSIWTYSTQRIALSRDTYTELFNDQGFYKELTPAVLPAIIKDLEKPAPGEISFSAAIDKLNREDYDRWQAIVRNPQAPLVNSGWVQREVEKNLDAFFSWLEDDTDRLVLVFDTRMLRENLLGQPGEIAVHEIVNALPACTASEEEVVRAYMEGSSTDVEFPYCHPQDPVLSDALLVKLNQARLNAANDLTDELDLVDEMEKGAQTHQAQTGESIPKGTFSDTGLAEFRSSIWLYQRLLILVFLIPLALLSLIVIVTVRSSRSFFRWMGWSLIVGSLMTLVPLVLLPLMFASYSGQSQHDVQAEFAAGGELVAEILVNGMGRLVIGEFTMPVLEESAVLIAVGFASVVLSVLLPDPDETPEPTILTFQTPTGLTLRSTAAPASDDNTLPPV